jgi:DNA polymerase-3 subunit beta
VTITAADPERGAASEVIEGDAIEYTADPVEIGFQARYLADVTDLIGAAIEFRLLDDLAPAVLVDPDDTSALYVLMPMRV